MSGQMLEVAAERPVAGGLSLGRCEGRIVLISGAIPGERVRVRVDKATKQVIFASTVSVIDASPHRRTVSGDPACGGLAYAHVAYAHQLSLKADVVADAFRRLGKITLEAPVPVEPSPERGYRMRARLHVRGGRVGFFREGTHTWCDAGQTAQLTAPMLAAGEALVAAWGAAAEACDTITLAENVDGTERVAHAEARPGLAATALAIESLPAGLTGVTAADARGRTTLAGSPFVSDRARDLCPADERLSPDVTWRRSAASFFQGNRFLTGRVVSAVLDAADRAGGRVADLYAGVGLFSVALASRGVHVVAVESDTSAVEDLDVNRLPFGDRVDVLDVPVEIAVGRIHPGVADTVIVDPPRTGLSPEALAGVIHLGAPRVVYVSCDPPTLARDAKGLLEAGYALSSLEAFDMFPNTAHIEAACVFDRKRA